MSCESEIANPMEPYNEASSYPKPTSTLPAEEQTYPNAPIATGRSANCQGMGNINASNRKWSGVLYLLQRQEKLTLYKIALYSLFFINVVYSIRVQKEQFVHQLSVALAGILVIISIDVIRLLPWAWKYIKDTPRKHGMKTLYKITLFVLFFINLMYSVEVRKEPFVQNLSLTLAGFLIIISIDAIMLLLWAWQYIQDTQQETNLQAREAMKQAEDY